MSNIQKTLGLGAVIKADYRNDMDCDQRRLWVKVHGHGAVWWDESDETATWEELGEIEVLSHGYFPPVEEPKRWGAVVRDADGTDWVYVCGMMLNPWRARKMLGDSSHFVDKEWANIPQPVEVLFEGVG